MCSRRVPLGVQPLPLCCCSATSAHHSGTFLPRPALQIKAFYSFVQEWKQAQLQAAQQTLDEGRVAQVLRHAEQTVRWHSAGHTACISSHEQAT